MTRDQCGGAVLLRSVHRWEAVSGRGSTEVDDGWGESGGGG